jgi:hypothetical protein
MLCRYQGATLTILNNNRRIDMNYKFTISYLEDGVIKTYSEVKPFLNQGSAYIHFTGLCEDYNVGPYYYLCSWEEV